MQWATKTPHDAFNSLKLPDVTVTNKKDKGDQLPKILDFDAKVREAFAGYELLSPRVEKGGDQ